MLGQEYKKMLETMHKELEALLELQEDTEQKIAQLKQAIISLVPLARERDGLGDQMVQSFITQGTTEGIREILRAAFPTPLNPVEIKEQLKNRGQDLSQHKNVMASVHSTLKRMLENHEITTDNSGLTYRWKRRRVHLGRFMGAMTPPPGTPMTPPTTTSNLLDAPPVVVGANLLGSKGKKT